MEHWLLYSHNSVAEKIAFDKLCKIYEFNPFEYLIEEEESIV